MVASVVTLYFKRLGFTLFPFCKISMEENNHIKWLRKRLRNSFKKKNKSALRIKKLRIISLFPVLIYSFSLMSFIISFTIIYYGYSNDAKLSTKKSIRFESLFGKIADTTVNEWIQVKFIKTLT